MYKQWTWSDAGLNTRHWAVSAYLPAFVWQDRIRDTALMWLSAPHFTPSLSLPSEIPRPTVSGLPSMRRWASPVLSSWAARPRSRSRSGLSGMEKGGMSGKFSPTQCGRMCLVMWPCGVWACHEAQRKGWTVMWWKGWIAKRWKLFPALYFGFGLLWQGLTTLTFTILADQLCAIQNIAAKNPLYWHCDWKDVFLSKLGTAKRFGRVIQGVTCALFCRCPFAKL